MHKFHYGINARFTIPDDVSLVAVGRPTLPPLDAATITDRVRALLQTPLNYPPLQDAVLQEDQVVLAVGEGVRCAEDIVAGAVLELLQIGVDAQNIKVILTGLSRQATGTSFTKRLPGELQERIEVLVHRPDDRESLSFLAPVEGGDSVYVNRFIVDADVVISIGSLRPQSSLGYLGVDETLFPRFSDKPTQQKYARPKSVLSSTEANKRSDEAHNAIWQLGSRLTIQVIPGADNSVLDILCGDCDTVQTEGQKRCDDAWTFEVPSRTDMVIATINGDRRQQTWANLARSIDAALRVIEDDGTLVICCDLKTPPGPAIQKLAGSESLENAYQVLAKTQSKDALAAMQLTQAMERTRVYLLSELSEELVEELGVAFVTHPDEIARLASRHDSCIVLENAQQAVALVRDEVLS
ncbi:MAG: lactate racemase domain-containing protein [Pirellulaceae bacterium]